jgi:protein gp37
MTKIEWTDITWNPVTGCSWVSPGCDNCYAKRMAKRLKAMGQSKYCNEFEPTCHPGALHDQFPKKPKKIFVCSMSDLFHEDIHFSFIWAIFRKIRINSQHTFQILTKRPERMSRFIKKFQPEFMPENLWIGVTAENQYQYEKRSYELASINCRVKFVSIEPMLSSIELFGYVPDWVIVGGETGPKARTMNPDWVRSIRDQCKAESIPFFFKQMSNKQPIPDDLMIKEFPVIKER